METLMGEIRALGHIPRKTHRHVDEFSLYQRCRYAKLNGLLSESQLAELAKFPASNWRELRTAGRIEALMGEIRALGHTPRRG